MDEATTQWGNGQSTCTLARIPISARVPVEWPERQEWRMLGTVEGSGCVRSGALRLDGTVRGICVRGLIACRGAPDSRGGRHGAGSGQGTQA